MSKVHHSTWLAVIDHHTTFPNITRLHNSFPCKMLPETRGAWHEKAAPTESGAPYDQERPPNLPDRLWNAN